MNQLLRMLIGGPFFALLWAIPGALVGAGAGFFDLHLGAALGLAIIFIFWYPRSRQRRGEPADFILYYVTACGAAGLGLGCYYVGGIVSAIQATA